MSDVILIDSLELSARIGISDEERAEPQRLTVTLELKPLQNFTTLEDRIEKAVDYFKVCERAKKIAAESRCALIETLAEKIAHTLIDDFSIQGINVELRKYILPDTRYVSVKIHRE